jgi:DNA-binding GntR family transcriptional regulator
MANSLKLKPVGNNFSLKEHIYDVLKDAISSINLYDANANLRLDERALAEQLGISRTPVREALTRLEQEGFVEVQPRKGVFIRRKSLDEILDMIVVWASLESMAARMAVHHASDKEIATLRKALPKEKGESELRSHMHEYSEANIAFHLRILELSGSPMLLDIAKGLFLHMRSIRERAMAEGDRITRSVVDHMNIIEAIEGRNAELASMLVREHTMRLHGHVRKHWNTFSGNIEAAG